MKQLTFKLKKGFPLRNISVLAFFVIMGFCANAQTTDSVPKPEKEFKNSVKLNITSRIFYKNAFQVSYERVIRKNQTLNFFGGYQEFPGNVIVSLENTQLADQKKKSGYSFGLEYRFYLAKENKHKAPHGVYLAPFISYYHFNSDRVMTHTDSTGVQSSANLGMQINFLNVGGVLGYQFVLGRRWVIDAAMFGPALSSYNFKARLQNDIPGVDTDEALQAVIDALIDKFPLLNDLTSEQGAKKSGTEAFWSVGFRYNISIGFRF